MRITMRTRQPKELPVGALILGGLFFMPLAAMMVEGDLISLGRCSVKEILGVPCLTCGSTRATLELVSGQFLSAFLMQPLMISLYVALGIWGVTSFCVFVAGRSVDLAWTSQESRWIKISMVTLPIVNWWYLVEMGI
jgi:hypothetical protein